MGDPSAIAMAVLLAMLPGAPLHARQAEPSRQALPARFAFPGDDNLQAEAGRPGWPAAQARPGTGGKPGDSQQDAAKGADKDEGRDVRFVWRTGPSLRVGRDLRVDFRLKLQADFRGSSQDLEPAGGTFEIPRRRAGIKGHVFRVVEFEVEHDLGGESRWRDVYLNLRPFNEVQVQAGKFKVPFSLEQLTASDELNFLYRTLAAETLAPNRDVGIKVHGRAWGRAITYQVGTFRGSGENAPGMRPPLLLPGEEVEIPSERSFAGRVTVRPLRPVSLPPAFDTLEVGVSAMRSDVPEGPNHLQGRTIFGTEFFRRNFYVNGPRTRTGFDVSWTPGPASIQGEYLRVQESRMGVGVGDESGLDSDLPSLPSRGWYVSGTWALTGEKKSGGIQPRRPFPLRGPGAIEIAARYETLRFGGGDTSEPASLSPRAANAAGNAEKILTLGVNWYINRFVRLQFNGINERVEDVSFSPVADRESVWSFAFRLQFVM